MGCFELSLEILVNLEGVSHVVVHQELIRDVKRNKELGGICSSLQLRLSCEDPVHDVLNCSLVSVHDFSLEIHVEVTGVSQDLEISTDPLLGFVLRLSLDVNCVVRGLKLSKDFVEQLQELKWRLIVEFDETEILHVWWSVKAVNDRLNIVGGKAWRLSEYFVWSFMSIYSV
jgi:hypothetical protein